MIVFSRIVCSGHKISVRKLNNTFVTVNNDFWVIVMRSLANRLTRDPKIVIHGNSCIILYIQALLRLRMATHQFVVPLVDWVLADLAHMLHPLSLKQSSEMSQIHKNWWICLHKTKFSIGVCKLYIWKRRVVMIQTFSSLAALGVVSPQCRHLRQSWHHDNVAVKLWDRSCMGHEPYPR